MHSRCDWLRFLLRHMLHPTPPTCIQDLSKTSVRRFQVKLRSPWSNFHHEARAPQPIKASSFWGSCVETLRVWREESQRNTQKRCNRRSSVITDLLLGFSRTKSLASTSAIPPPSNFPPHPCHFCWIQQPSKASPMVWHCRVLLQSRLKKFHCPPEASGSMQLWSDTGITPHRWHKISLDYKKGGWGSIFFRKKEMKQSISTYPFRICIS